jgi:hypothetical protein
MTIHSFFGINPSKTSGKEAGLPDAKLLQVTKRLMPLRDLIIEEFSQLGSKVMYEMHCVHKQCCGKLDLYEEGKPFGGMVSVGFSGHTFQLSPINSGKELCNFSTCDAGQRIFHDVVRSRNVFVLKAPMRQDSQDPIVLILERLMLGVSTEADRIYLNKHCGSSSPGCEKFVADRETVDVFTRNRDINDYTRRVMLRSQHEEGLPTMRFIFSAEYGTSCGGVWDQLYFQRGARVSLSRNLNVGAGVVNGLEGILWDVGWIAGEPADVQAPPVPDAVIVLVREDAVAVPTAFPAPRGFKAIVVEPLVGAQTRDYGDTGTSSKRAVPRRGIPLRNAEATSDYKVQGLSLSKVHAHLPCCGGDSGCDASGAGTSTEKIKVGSDYVILSRVTSTAALKLAKDIPQFRLEKIKYSRVNVRVKSGPRIGKLLSRVLKVPLQERIDAVTRVNAAATERRGGRVFREVKRSALKSTRVPWPRPPPPCGFVQPVLQWVDPLLHASGVVGDYDLGVDEMLIADEPTDDEMCVDTPAHGGDSGGDSGNAIDVGVGPQTVGPPPTAHAFGTEQSPACSAGCAQGEQLFLGSTAWWPAGVAGSAC